MIARALNFARSIPQSLAPQKPYTALDSFEQTALEHAPQPVTLIPPNPRALEIIAQHETPVLMYDLRIVENNYRAIAKALPQAQIFYAVKVDSHPRILQTLADLGASFDVASRREIEQVLETGCPPSRLSYSNTVKRPQDIRWAYEQGVRIFAADSLPEVQKIAQAAPGSKLFIRLAVPDTDAHYRLTKKFGAPTELAQELLIQGRRLGLDPYGAAFHVGSQCYDAKAWETPLSEIAQLSHRLLAHNIVLSFIDVGGGFPTQYKVGTRSAVPAISDIGGVISTHIARLMPQFNGVVAAEPGRFIVGDAAILATQVILRAEREGNKTWLHLDAGVYHGLCEAAYNLEYEVVVPGHDANEARAPFTLAGPTCDSTDVFYRDLMLPASIAQGELLVFLKTGAYATACSTHFNGFAPPEVVFCNDSIA